MIAEFDHDALAAIVYSDEAVLLLFGDDEEGLTQARDAAARARCRVGAEVGLAEAQRRLDDQADVQAAVVVASTPSAMLDRLLIRIEDEARSRRLPAVVVTPATLIDTVASLCTDRRIHHLVDPGAGELQAHIAALTAPAPARVHEADGAPAIGVLQQLSDDAARIAAALAALSSDASGFAHPALSLRGDEEPAADDSSFVRSIIRARRMRDHYFQGALFADPAFDMLLDLYAARLEQARVAVSSLCIASAVPATTALRWIKALTERGLFIRFADPQDGRRIYIDLSDAAAQAMGAYFAAVQRAGVITL